MNVPLLDLKAQYSGHKAELDAALLRVAASQHFILGKEVSALEREMERYLGADHALGVSSGTDALLLALMALGVGSGDEVIVPSFSFFATAGVVSRLGARPVFVDIDPVSFNIDPEQIEAAITPRTRAIVPVHLFGQCAEMSRIMSIATGHGIAVVEDAAQAIGARFADGRSAGAIGTVGCFSFFPSKNLGCFGDGGLVSTSDHALHEQMRIMRVHGGEPKYHHAVIGGNFRLDEIQAAVLAVKLPHLDAWSRQRNDNARRYSRMVIERGLSSGEGGTELGRGERVLLPLPVYRDAGIDNYHIYNQYVIRVEKRDALRTWLTGRGIGSEIYYPIPLHLQECFAGLGYLRGQLPVAERTAEQVLALPIFPELTDDQAEYVVDSIAEFFQTGR